MNTLYYGDNLDILRNPEYIKPESVDLIYLDPPFNSNASYNVLFSDKGGNKSAAQLQAFKDTWSWPEAAETYQELIMDDSDIAHALLAFHRLIGEGGLLAYLVMMAPRLAALHRVLKPTGSIYLHCDPTASHYLKVLMDAIFGAETFTNEISWRRTTTKNDYRQGAQNWPRIRDVLLHYRRAPRSIGVFNQQFTGYSEEYIRAKYPYADENGRRYGLDNLTAPGAGTRGHPQYELLGVTR